MINEKTKIAIIGQFVHLLTLQFEASLPRTVWFRKENINVMRIRNRLPVRKFFPTIKGYRLKEMARN